MVWKLAQGCCCSIVPTSAHLQMGKPRYARRAATATHLAQGLFCSVAPTFARWRNKLRRRSIRYADPVDPSVLAMKPALSYCWSMVLTRTLQVSLGECQWPAPRFCGIYQAAPCLWGSPRPENSTTFPTGFCKKVATYQLKLRAAFQMQCGVWLCAKGGLWLADGSKG